VRRLQFSDVAAEAADDMWRVFPGDL
jgi:hypothetical protein